MLVVVMVVVMLGLSGGCSSADGDSELVLVHVVMVVVMVGLSWWL